MQIVSAFSGANLNEQKIQNSFQKLGFVITKGTGANITRTLLEAVKLELYKAGGGDGQVHISKDINLYDLIEISAHHEGMFQLANATFKGSIDISTQGSLKPDSDEYIGLKMTGFDAGWIVNVYGLETSINTKSHIKYDRESITTGLQTRFDTSGAYQMAFPIANVAAVEMEFVIPSIGADGKPSTTTKTVEFLPDELTLMGLDYQDVFQVDAQPAAYTYYGSEKFWHLNLVHVNAVKVTPVDNTATIIYFLREGTIK